MQARCVIGVGQGEVVKSSYRYLLLLLQYTARKGEEGRVFRVLQLTIRKRGEGEGILNPYH